MIKVGIFFGGASREREISFAGGRTVYDNLDKSLFEPVPLFLDSAGHLILLDWQYVYKGTIRDFYPPADYQPQEYQIYAEHLDGGQVDWDALISRVGRRVSWPEMPGLIDVAFLALHGAGGEDGSIQGMLELLGIPYTGSGILPSAIGMNKAFQKRILRSTSFDRSSFFTVSREEWLHGDRDALLARVAGEIGLPYVVRPANQGSSIGVSILHDAHRARFDGAMDQAFFMYRLDRNEWTGLDAPGKADWVRRLLDIKQHIGLPVRIGEELITGPHALLYFLDGRFGAGEESLLLESVQEESEVVVESFIRGREFSCVVVEGMDGNPIALPPTEIVKRDEVYDYRSKYLAGLSRKVTPIDLPGDAVREIRRECRNLYKLLRFDVYARIDGFFREDGAIVLNDPNTTSGMLPSSFFFHQAAEIGLNPSQFITYIIHASLRARIRHGGAVLAVRQLLARLEGAMDRIQQGSAPRKRVAVILGGYSSERHISVESGRNIYEKLTSSARHEAVPVFLTRENGALCFYVLPIHLLLKDNADDIADKLRVHKAHDVVEEIRRESAGLIARFGSRDYAFFPERLSAEDLKARFDLAFIALHGRPGEDGTLQREFDRLGIPYNGSPPESAEVTIDKHLTKEILRAHGFTVARDRLLSKAEWLAGAHDAVDSVALAFGFPLIAKPVDDGCSSAVRKISGREELAAFARALFRDSEQVDPKDAALLGLKHNEEFPAKEVLLVEELIGPAGAARFLEITGGMLTRRPSPGGPLEFESFEPSEALAGEAVLSLEEKFLAGQGQNITPARFDPDPERSREISRRVQADLVRAAEILGVEGYCRIDAFVRVFDNGKVETVIIEVNSLPGMTPATCIFHQAALKGYQPIDFIDKILTFAETGKNASRHALEAR